MPDDDLESLTGFDTLDFADHDSEEVATNSQHVQGLRFMFKDMVSLLNVEEVFKKVNAKGEKWEKDNPKTTSEEKNSQNANQTKGSKI
nr:hypothetical protein [Tanacetum cinerariifolium]